MHDIDYTSNASGIFQKDELTDYLINHEDFSFDKTNSTSQIAKDDDKVSQWCLTFYDRSNQFDEKLRGKFYGKAISQITSGKVREDLIGVNIHYFLEPRDDRLQKAFKETVKTGLTRIEFTVYCTELPELDSLHNYCDYMFDLCKHSGCYMKVTQKYMGGNLQKIKYLCCIAIEEK